MTRQTHFEVHVHQHGRWTIHARYPLFKKEAALEDAKQLDTQNVGQVKVIREVFDDETGNHEEYTIYKTPIAGQASAMEEAMGQISEHKPSGGGRPKVMGRRISGAGDDFDFDFELYDGPYRGKRRKRTTVSFVFVKILVLLLISTVIAGGAALTAGIWIDGVNFFGARMVGAVKNNMLFGIFFGAFAISAVVLSTIFFRHDSLVSGRRRRRGKKGGKRGKTGENAGADAQSQKQKEAAGVSIAAAVEELRRSFGEESLQAANEDSPGPEKEKTDQAGMLSPAAEKQRQYMAAFMKNSLQGAPAVQSMDNFSKFGVNLYIAGACEALAHKSKISGSEHIRILGGAVSAVGFKKNRAAAFAKRYEEYLGQDPRYMQMFEAGRAAMTRNFTDTAQAAGNFKKAMEEWAPAKTREGGQDVTGEVSVLFTDIAGSTALTQKLGDIGAQQVVRAHNKLVREALTAHGGREVKHTGDGIMASFATPVNAVLAAADMQKGAMAVRNALKLPLHLKIGVNAGEVIQEDNDLFGAAVQMAARIVEIARADEIIISESVQAGGGNAGREFINRGAFSMKGFDEDPMVWEVKWWDGPQPPKLKTGAAADAGRSKVAPVQAAQEAPAAQPGAPARRSGVRLVQPPRR